MDSRRYRVFRWKSWQVVEMRSNGIRRQGRDDNGQLYAARPITDLTPNPSPKERGTNKAMTFLSMLFEDYFMLLSILKMAFGNGFVSLPVLSTPSGGCFMRLAILQVPFRGYFMAFPILTVAWIGRGMALSVLSGALRDGSGALPILQVP
ncbi:MAG: hypothetical protein EOO16_17370 [Chitinophagaceae bacterium]|nr:MAG: hypothetical protein EOO16_17370 [Chitinophagaceae bacterium]